MTNTRRNGTDNHARPYRRVGRSIMGCCGYPSKRWNYWHWNVNGRQRDCDERLARRASAEVTELRLMAVHAHPDDESSKGAATMARYVREGVQVLVCTLTGGERGDILNPAMDRPEIKADIAAVRRAEMARAREILGVEQRFLGFTDSGLPEGDPKPPLPAGCFA